jgi:hypothetical protein
MTRVPDPGDPVGELPESQEYQEYLEPKVTPGWKTGLFALTASAVVAVVGTFQLFFTYANPGLGSPAAPESYRVTTTMWRNSTGVYAIVPKFGIPVVAAGGLLLLSVVLLLVAARWRLPRVLAFGRTLSFATTFLLGGALWSAQVYVSAIETGWKVSEPTLLFGRGPALWLLVVACALGLIGSALVLGRALGDRVSVPSTVVYRVPSDDTDDTDNTDDAGLDAA